MCIVLVIASVPLRGRITDLTRGEGARLDRIQRIATNRLDLFRELESDGLVRGGSPIRSRILVLLECGNLRVLGLDRSTKSRLLTDGSSVPLESAEDEGVDHTIDISDRLGIRERLVSDSLLQAVGIGDITLAVVRSGVSEQTEDGVDNLVGVIEVQGLSHSSEDGFMRVFWYRPSVARGGGHESGCKPCGTSRFQGRGIAKTEERRRRAERVNINMNGSWEDEEFKKGGKNGSIIIQ